MISSTELKSIERSINKRFDYLKQKVDNIQSNIEWTERAIDHFGTTDKPHEAGFILYDGQLLDFSGGYADQKRLDHAEIQQIYTDKELEKANKKHKPAGPIHLFQIQSNAIRLNSAQYSGYMYMSIYDSQIITPEQIKTIEYITKYDTTKHILYDVYNKDSRAVKYGEVSSVSELKNVLYKYVQLY